MDNLGKTNSRLSGFNSNLKSPSSKASKVVEDTLSKLEQVLKLRDNRHKSHDDVVEELKNKNRVLINTNSDLANKCREISLEVSRVRDLADSDKRKLIGDFESQKHTLNLNIASKTREISTLTNKVDLVSKTNTELNGKLKDLKSNVEALITSKNELQETVKNLEFAHEEKIRRIASDAERMIHQANAKADSEKRRAFAQLREAEAKVTDIRSEAEKNISEYRDKVEYERMRNDELSREKESLRAEIERLNTVVLSVQATVEQLLSEEMRLAGSYEATRESVFDVSDSNYLAEVSAQRYFEEEDKAPVKHGDNFNIGYIDLTSSLLSSAQEDFVRQP